MANERVKLGLAALLGLVAFAGAGALAEKGPPPPSRPSWRVPAGNVHRGEAIAQTCLTCHGPDAPAARDLHPRPPKLYRQRASYIFFVLREYQQGVRHNDLMRGMAEALSEQDMRDVAAYFSQNFPDKPPRARTDLPGYRITSRECTWCHGETGIGELEGTPVLTGQDPEYLAHALAAYRSGERTDPTMRAEAKRIAPADDAALATYFSAHEWLERGQ